MSINKFIEHFGPSNSKLYFIYSPKAQTTLWKLEKEMKHNGISQIRFFLRSLFNMCRDFLLDRYREMGISRSSRSLHKYLPSQAITANPVPLTTHHVIEEGQPPYMMHINKWMIKRVAEKSKHFFDLSIKYSIYPDLHKNKNIHTKKRQNNNN